MDKQTMPEFPKYGNWVPDKLMMLLWALCGVIGIFIFLNNKFWQNGLAMNILSVLFVIVLLYALYMHICRNLFSFGRGNLMGKIHAFVLSKLDWDGKGKVLDIGCGSGAMSILCVKKFRKCTVTGMDYWGSGWDYGKEQCEKNAQLEKAKRCEFVQGDARNIPFPDKSFEAVISNFVFHEIRTEKDKRRLVREALRVLKPGGVFALQDMFGSKRLYGDMNEFVEELKAEGIREIHYEANTEKEDFIPRFVRTPMMLKNVGIIYGKK